MKNSTIVRDDDGKILGVQRGHRTYKITRDANGQIESLEEIPDAALQGMLSELRKLVADQKKSHSDLVRLLRREDDDEQKGK